MANNQKAEEYLTEVIKRVSGARDRTEELSADNIAIPDEKDLLNLEDVEYPFDSMGDEEFLEMLIRVNEQMEEKNLIPPEFSTKAAKEKEKKEAELEEENIQKAESELEEGTSKEGSESKAVPPQAESKLEEKVPEEELGLEEILQQTDPKLEEEITKAESEQEESISKAEPNLEEEMTKAKPELEEILQQEEPKLEEMEKDIAKAEPEEIFQQAESELEEGVSKAKAESAREGAEIASKEIEEPEISIPSEDVSIKETSIIKTESETDRMGTQDGLEPSEKQLGFGTELQETGQEELERIKGESEITAASEQEEGGTKGEVGTKLNEEAENVDLGNVIDFDSELEESKPQEGSLKDMTEGDDEDLMASLDSIVQEIQGETSSEDSDDQESENGWEEDSEFSGEYEQITAGEEEAAAKKGKKKKAKKVKGKGAAKKKEAKKKIPLGQRIKNMFFRVEVVQPLTEEEELQQKQLKAQEKEAKKKADADAKKKKTAEKKEAAKKKKEEAAAKKAAKPKKEKKPKPPKQPISPEEIVHIRPMFLVFLASVAAAIVLSTVTLSDTFGYRLAVEKARNDLENGNYEEAFEALNGLEFNHSDEQLYESVRILMRVQKQYRSYVNYSLMDMQNEALHSLVKAVENYDKYVDIAENYGIKDKLDELLSNVEYALGIYQLNLATVREWNSLEDTNEYTKKIMACTGSY